MYKLIRYGKRFNNKQFNSYEDARSYLRKWLRKNLDLSGNPELSSFGFSISKTI